MFREMHLQKKTKTLLFFSKKISSDKHNGDLNKCEYSKLLSIYTTLSNPKKDLFKT